MTWYLEHRRNVERNGPLSYVPLADIAGKTGFRSVYCIDELTRDAVLSAGSVRDLSGVPVYSDTLFIDFDDDDGVGATVEFLQKNAITYQWWTTGRRGAHFHIPILPMVGSAVPYSQLEWVKANITGIWDATIYRAHSIIRLPGTYHEKAPGQFKQMIEAHEFPSMQLEIPMLQVPPPIEIPGQHEGSRNEAEFWKQINVPKRSPGRTNRVFFLGALARECGLEYDEGLKAVRHWAETACIPPLKDDRELTRAYRSGYKG